MNKNGTSRLTSDYHRAFVATFVGTERDELEYAKLAIQQAGADARYKPMDPCALTHDLLQYAYDFEGVAPWGLMLPVWAIYRELRRDGVVVSLDGLGADELLMGYGNSLRTLLKANGNLMTRPFRTFDLARTLQKQFPEGASVARILRESDPTLRFLARTVRHARGDFKPVAEMQAPNAAWVKRWIGTDDEMDASERASVNSLNPIDRELYQQFHHGVNQTLLRKYDRISMAHGVEVRLPFMDWRLVTFAFSLPEESKIGGGFSKRILREAMRGILPEKIRLRSAKIGFQSPMKDWMNSGLGNWVANRSQTKHFLESPVSNGPAIRDFIATRQAAKNWSNEDGWLVWCHVQADLWREAFFSGAASQSH
jgi:asparagine synthase (glutamine-hydrolysing)